MSKRKPTNKVRIYKSNMVNWCVIVTDQFNNILLDSAGFYTELDAVKYYRKWKHSQ
jgi:hypothetical protein